MFFQLFIITVAIVPITPLPIVRTTTTTKSITTTEDPTTLTVSTITKTFTTLSTTTKSITNVSTVIETITSSSTKEMLSTSSTIITTKTTSTFVTKAAKITKHNKHSPYNRPCLVSGYNIGWLCDDQTTCVWQRTVCDGFSYGGCPDGSDEESGCDEDPRYCPFEGGKPGWRCDTGECIKKTRACNGLPECSDGSDERAGCATMDLVSCPTDSNILTEKWAANFNCRWCWDFTNNWRCNNGLCTRKERVCDGFSGDCLDGSDEWKGCELVPCKNDSSILTAVEFADGDCRRCSGKGGWRCNGGHCIHKALLCDGAKDCPSGEDETVGCSPLVPCLDRGISVLTEPKYSQSGQCRACFDPSFWRCNNGQCIHVREVCNNVLFGRNDCKDGSDEEPGSGCPANITCVADKSIITTPYFFNGTSLTCLSCSGDLKGTVADNYKRCKTGQCKPKVHFCNGYEDCDDASDEYGCNIFSYFDTKKAVLLSLGLVAMTAYLYIKYTNFHSISLTSTQKKFPKKTPRLYRNIQKYCDILESDTDDNTDRLKKFHKAIRKKRNGLRQLIVAVTSLYEEPQLCHKYSNQVLNLENEFHEGITESLMYIRMVAGSNKYTEKFANALESPGFFSKISFAFTNRLEYISLKTGHFINLMTVLSKMVLFYLDIIKDVTLFFKLWYIVSQLEEVNILHHVLLYISCIIIFLAQSIIGLYFVVKLGNPQKKLPPSLFTLVLFLLFLISPVIPIVLVVKDSLLNSAIEEAKYEMKKDKRNGMTKFFMIVSLQNKEATETKQLFSFHKIINSVLESLPQLIIYCIFCLTYYYGNSLVDTIFNNTNSEDIILFACSIPLSLFTLVSGISTYTSIDGKSHYTKKLSYLLQVVSRICAILTFISPLYALYFTTFKTLFESFIRHAGNNWIPHFFTTSLISVTYPHITSLFIMFILTFALHGIFIYFYSHKNNPGFSDAPFFHKLTHIITNTFIVQPWRPLGQEVQRRRSKEHENYHLAMAASNIIIIIFSSIFREYTQIDFIFLGLGTKVHLEWIHHNAEWYFRSTLPLLDKLSPYHYPIGLLLNVIAHIPWLLLVLVLQGISVGIMSIYYKRFHPWRAIINTTNINKTTMVQEIFSTINETLEEDSEVEWVEEDEMENDTDTNENEEEDCGDSGEDDISVSHEENGEQYELQEIFHLSYSSGYNLEKDRSSLKKTLDIDRRKREYARRKFFSEITKTKSCDGKIQEELFLVKNKEVQLYVEIHSTEEKEKLTVNEREEPCEVTEVKNEENHLNKVPVSLLEHNGEEFLDVIIFKDEQQNKKDQDSSKAICMEILLDLINNVEDFMKETEINIQYTCKQIILELIDDTVNTVYH